MEGTDAKANIEELIGKATKMITELQSKMDSLESKFNDIVDGANASYNDWEHNKKKEEFTKNHQDFLDKYSDKLKAIEGDDFDLAEEAMGLDDGSEDFIVKLSSQIDSELERIAKAFGGEVEIKQEDGKTEVKADGETIAETEETEVSEAAEDIKEQADEAIEKKEEPEDDDYSDLDTNFKVHKAM